MREQEPSTPTFQFFGTKTLREVAWFSDVRGRSRPLRFSPSSRQAMREANSNVFYSITNNAIEIEVRESIKA